VRADYEGGARRQHPGGACGLRRVRGRRALATWLGLAFGWRCPAAWFRNLHLAAIAFVVAESILGVVCPLTAWEDALRGQRTDAGFSSAGSAWLF
jgi:hypothetical protein